jgi:hypothetical protein
MDKEQQKTIRKFETWQMRKLASNAKKGYYFFQPDNVATPTPRSAREAWGSEYRNGHLDDKQERITTWVMYALVVSYFAFLIWREFQ